MTQDKPTKTAMMTLYSELRLPGALSDRYKVLNRITELLELEKTQIELAAIWGANHAIDNLGNAVADSGKAFENYFTQTYKQ